MFSADSPQKRLLVVEDNDVERHAIMELLKLTGYFVMAASSGEEALHFVHDKIDLVVIDFHMGAVTGGEVLKRWLRINPDTHFIFLTGEDRAETAVTMIRSGATEYLTKPVNPEVLLAKIEEALHSICSAA